MTEPSEGDEGAPVVALDVGGTQIKGGVLAEDGTLVQSERRPTRAERGPDAVLDTVLTFAADLTERYRPAAAGSGSSDAYAGAEALRAAGARAVVASLGPDGMIALTPHGSWRPAPPAALAGNPTGAGDAAVAALAVGLVAQTSWPIRLAEAVALSAAAVAAPLAGDFDPALHRRLLPQVAVEPLRTREGGSPCR
ncbi:MULTISPECIES: PfkB family carbohydrate kinase [Kitasatospora]|uniref:PfkB family carbohydrate kinase n=1 Tax=Kitasatospora TaxID=2063 RepID=UPI000C709FA6|nr:PfkB family carbohydrate kinase [Kitasatospora sp. GP30]MDH6140032.1 hypothetical protein [Kitasatospora sp. GP30]